MKIKFTKLPTNDGTIKVSLDGGQSFTDYNIVDIHESGIPLEDNQDYEKIQVKAPANVLKNLDIVASVKVEGEGAETGSTNEPSFIMDTDTYGFNFPECVTEIIIPNGITTIDKNVFSTHPNLQTVVIPEGVTSIGDYAFYDCSSLTSITIPESVTSIGSGAFSDCSGLTSITIPESVTSIGQGAFRGCSGLTSITIPDSVTSIGERAFFGCPNLKTIYVSEGFDTTLLDGKVPEGATIEVLEEYIITQADLDQGNSHLQTLTAEYPVCRIADGVTSIGRNAFYDCSSLTSITIPESVTTIGDYAFIYCESLTSITIPESVTSIGQGAFSGCTGLTSINIPNSVTSIGQGAFSGCSSLATINYTGTEEQWNAISKGTDWNYGTSLNVIYNYKPE